MVKVSHLIAVELKTRKLARLQESRPDRIATANIGLSCAASRRGTRAVRHCVELLVEALPHSAGNLEPTAADNGHSPFRSLLGQSQTPFKSLLASSPSR